MSLYAKWAEDSEIPISDIPEQEDCEWWWLILIVIMLIIIYFVQRAIRKNKKRKGTYLKNDQ